MFDYKLIEALAMVIQEGGFDRAARALLLTQSAVSQRVRQLEGQVGSPLVVRGSPPQPTAAGRRLIGHYRKVSLLERELRRDLEPGPSGEFLPLPIGVNEDSMATWFTDAIAALARDRGYTLHISVDDQDETHKLLRLGEVLACVSSRSGPLQGCAAVYLGRIDYLCLAAPEFLARWLPAGLDPEAVRRAPAVLYSTKDRVHDRFLQEALGTAPPPYPHHFIPSSHGFLDAISNGLGYGLVPHLQAGELLGGGRAVEVRPGTRLPVHLHWHHWDLDAAPIRELTEALVRYARGALPQGGAADRCSAGTGTPQGCR